MASHVLFAQFKLVAPTYQPKTTPDRHNCLEARFAHEDSLRLAISPTDIY